jgi:hypothetical protein
LQNFEIKSLKMSKLDYLKRYMSNDDADEKTKKKKKKKSKKVKAATG